MKTSLLFILLTSICFASQDASIVRFTNGDRLSGNVIALDLESLTWESELLKDHVQFNLDKVLELHLPAKIDDTWNEEASYVAELELVKGGVAKGHLIGLNDNEIRLNTWYAGELIFPRKNVKTINISSHSKMIYRGPDGIEGWTISGSENSWRYENNELVSNDSGSIGRNIDFTDEVKIGFEVRSKGTLRTKIILFSSEIAVPEPDSGYEITFHGSSARIRRLSDDTSLIGKSGPRRNQPNEKSNIDIRVSRITKNIMIYINDDLIGIWEDEAMGEISGKGLLFSSDQNNNNNIGISNILVSEWDGHVDESMSEEMQLRDQRLGIRHFNNRAMRVPTTQKPQELPEGRMMLQNGDTMEGEVLGIEGEMIKIKTPFTEVTFPVHRIKNITPNKTADLEEARIYSGDVRAHLADGSKLVFRLEGVKDGKIIGFSQNFGMAEFKQSAFKRIEFNIHP